jgi:hypothetical protein
MANPVNSAVFNSARHLAVIDDPQPGTIGTHNGNSPADDNEEIAPPYDIGIPDLFDETILTNDVNLTENTLDMSTAR